ncbi:MAG: hypothetical protein IJJ72_03900 [Bacteroidales bacterium]|nr:hypothetical protein [Bacteroidales bacterium]
MKASQFFIRALIVLAIAAVVDIICKPAMDSLRSASLRSNPDNYEMTSYYGVEMATEDMLILGASPATHHYIPAMLSDSLGLTVRNLGKDGAFLYCQICQARLILERYTPKYLIWDLNDDCLSHNLDWGDFIEIADYFPYRINDFSTAIIKEMGPVQLFSLHSNLYRYNSKLPEYLFAFVSGRNSQSGYVPLPAEQSFIPEITSMKVSENIHPLKARLLEEILLLCQEKGCHVILATSPRLADDGVQQTKQYEALEEIAQRLSIPYFNHHTDPRFSNELSLFRDTDHLNERGAELYTSCFIEDLHSCL